MSYSNKSNTFDSPVVTDIEWAGGFEKGYLKRYDRENKCDVPINGPFGFMELDTRTGVQGFSKANNCGIFSNEVNDQRSEELEVFSFRDGKKVALQVHNPITDEYTDIKPGTYSSIKASVKSAGGKYTSIVYAIVTTSGDELAKVGSIVRINVKGAFLSPYIETGKSGFEVMVDGSKEEKVGGNKFKSPILQLKPINAEQDAAANDADEKLQSFFVGYAESKLDRVEGTEVESEEELYANNPAPQPVPAGEVEEESPF